MQVCMQVFPTDDCTSGDVDGYGTFGGASMFRIWQMLEVIDVFYLYEDNKKNRPLSRNGLRMAKMRGGVNGSIQMLLFYEKCGLSSS